MVMMANNEEAGQMNGLEMFFSLKSTPRTTQRSHPRRHRKHAGVMRFARTTCLKCKTGVPVTGAFENELIATSPIAARRIGRQARVERCVGRRKMSR